MEMSQKMVQYPWPIDWLSWSQPIPDTVLICNHPLDLGLKPPWRIDLQGIALCCWVVWPGCAAPCATLAVEGLGWLSIAVRCGSESTKRWENVDWTKEPSWGYVGGRLVVSEGSLQSCAIVLKERSCRTLAFDFQFWCACFSYSM